MRNLIFAALLFTGVDLRAGILNTNGFYVITNPPIKVSLAWDASGDSSVVGYNLYYGVVSQQYTNFIPIMGVTNTGAIVSNLTYSTTYYFALTCFAPNGTNILESTFSGEVSYRTPGIPNPVLLHQPVKLAVQSRTGSGLWADTDMFWSFDPTITNEFFRLKLVQQ